MNDDDDLKQRVRAALARTEPTDAEAKADLERVLTRARKPGRPPWLIAAYAITAIALIALGVRQWRPRPPPPQPSAEGVHIYIHVVGEPEDQALALDLSVRGEK